MDQALKDKVNQILDKNFNLPIIADDDYIWQVLAKAVLNFHVKEDELVMFMSCYYVVLTYKNNTSNSSNTESIKIGALSYEGVVGYSNEVAKALNILQTLGYKKNSLGVVN